MRPNLGNAYWGGVLLVLAVPALAFGTDYWVSGSAGGTGSGTVGDPWRQLSTAAAANLLAGDVVHVLNGTYNPFQIGRSGATGNPITFRVENGQTATITGGFATGNQDGIRIRDASHLVVEGFRLVGGGDALSDRAGISVQSVLGGRLANGQVSGNHQDVVLRNNTISNYGTWGIFTAYMNGLVVEGNNLSGSRREHGLYISNASQNQIVRNNVAFGNFGSGLQLNGDFAFGGGGLITNAVVQNNLVFNNGVGGGGALNNEGVQQSRFQNNILYGNHASGIVLWIGGNGAPITNSSNNNVVVNNTVIQASDGRAAMNIDRGYDNVLFNNIFFNTGPSFRDAVAITTTDTRTVSNYNIFSANFELNGTDMNLAAWQAQTGGDGNSVVLTLAQLQALFVDYANNDYRLANDPNSAAIDHGIMQLLSYLAPNFDWNALPRPSGGGWDIGAHEFQAVPEPGMMSWWLAAAVAAFAAARRGNLFTFRVCCTKSTTASSERET